MLMVLGRSSSDYYTTIVVNDRVNSRYT